MNVLKRRDIKLPGDLAVFCCRPRMLHVWHRIMRLKGRPDDLQDVLVTEISLLHRPDIFLAYEWILQDFNQTSAFVRFSTHADNRKRMTPLDLEKKMRFIYASMRRQYLYLTHPVTFVLYAGWYIPGNLFRTSCLLALRVKQITSRVTHYEEFPESDPVRKMIDENHIWKRMQRYLPDEYAAIQERVHQYHNHLLRTRV